MSRLGLDRRAKDDTDDVEQGRTAWWSRLRDPQVVIVAIVALLIIYLAAVPLVYLLWGTFSDESGFTLDHFAEAYQIEHGLELLRNSVVFTVGATALNVAIGTALAYLVERTDVRFKGLIFVMSLVPIVIPGILYTISWIFLASPGIGLYNAMLEPIFGEGAISIFSMWGMILVQGLDNTPLVFLLMLAAFRSMDASLEESALMSGATAPQVIRRVTLPLVRPAVVACTVIMGIRNLESFETPALLGIPSGIWVFTSEIWRALSMSFPPAYGVAGAISLPLILVATLGIYYMSRYTRRGDEFQTITGKGFRPRTMRLGRWRNMISAAIIGYFLIALVVPMAVMVYLSFQPFYQVPSLSALADSTLENYQYILEFDQTSRAFINSLILAIGSATVVMLITAIASWLVIRTKVPGRWMLDNFTFVPLILPGLVLGVAILFVYLRFPIGIYGTLWILLLAYCTRALPYGMRYASASMFQISSELEESAKTSGASWWKTFRRIILPLLTPGLIAGWIYIVMISFRELTASLLLYTPGNEVLAVMIWEQYNNGHFSRLSALGVVMIITLVALAAGARWLGKRFGVQSV